MWRTPADRLLIRTAKTNVGWSLVLLFSALGGSIAALVLPAILSTAIDAQTTGGDPGAVGRLAGILAVLLLLDILNLLVNPWHVSTLTLVLRRDLLAHVLRLAVHERAAFTTGDLTSRLLTNTSEVAGVVPLMASWLSSLLVSGGALAALAMIDWRLCVAFVLGAPVGAVLVRLFVGRVSPLMTAYMTVQGAIAGRLMEVLTGLRSVRAAGTQQREIDRVLADLPSLHDAGRRSWLMQGKLNLQASFLMPLIQVAVIGTAGYILLEGGLTPGRFTAATAYAGMALGLFGQANAFMALAKARAGARRIADVLAVQGVSPGWRDLPDGPGELVFPPGDRAQVRRPGA